MVVKINDGSLPRLKKKEAITPYMFFSAFSVLAKELANLRDGTV